MITLLSYFGYFILGLYAGRRWGARDRPATDAISRKVIEAARKVAFHRKVAGEGIISTHTAILTVDGEAPVYLSVSTHELQANRCGAV